jgi:MFS family permease
MAAASFPLSRRNFYLGLVNGAVTMLGGALLDPGTVIAAFVVQLMGGNVLWVGLVISLYSCATQLPMTLLANRLETVRQRMPYYWFSAIVRSLSWLGLGLVLVFGHGLSPLTLFLTVCASFLLWGLGAGVGAIPFWSIVSDSIPPNWRGRYFGIRQFAGGLLCIGAGIYVRHMLGPDSGVPFPRNYGVLALWATVAVAIGVAAFCANEDRPAVTQKRRVPLGFQLRRGPRAWRRDTNYRRLLRAIIGYGLAMALVSPFLVPYGLKHLQLGVGAVGIFLIARQVAFSLSSFLWSYVSDARGNRLLMLITASLALLVPAAMLAAPLVPTEARVVMLGLSIEAGLAYLTAVFVLLGLATGGLELGYNNYLLEVAPPRKRSTYIGFLSTLNLVLAWAPLAGALLIGQAGRYTLGFALSLVAAGVCLYNVMRLGEVRGDNGET